MRKTSPIFIYLSYFSQIVDTDSQSFRSALDFLEDKADSFKNTAKYFILIQIRAQKIKYSI